MTISSHSHLRDVDINQQPDSPFLINTSTNDKSHATSSYKSQKHHKSSSSLTEDELEALQDPQFREFFKNVLEMPELREKLEEHSRITPVVPSDSFIPETGFVVKTRITQSSRAFPQDTKVFINVCHSHLVPSPLHISDQALRVIIQTKDLSNYQIPLQLVGPRADTDKTDRACIVFDVCVNSNIFHKASKNLDFIEFLVEFGLQWIENKHKIPLSRDYVYPKMVAKGKLQKQVVKRVEQVEQMSCIVEEVRKINYTIVMSDDERRIQIKIELPMIVNSVFYYFCLIYIF